MTLSRAVRVLGCLAAGVAVSAMAACSVPADPDRAESSGSGSVTAPWGSAKPSAPSKPSAAPKPSAAAPVDPLVAKVGGTFTYPDGVVVSVVSISRTTFRPRADGYVAGNVGVLVSIRVTNGSKAAVDVGTIVHMHTGRDGVEAGRVIDTRAGAGRGPHGVVPPGSAVSGAVGFSVAPTDLGPARVQVELRGSDRPEEPVFIGTVS